MKLEINLSDIPTKPGVYLFINNKDKVIYVGKAKSLKKRLSSYLNTSKKSIKTEKMLSHVKSLKTIVTENEVEAFLLEANIIKTELPKYNILLKDSKTYPYVKITNEDYPRLIYTRQTNDTTATYFGPFVNVNDLKQIIELLQDSFPLRTCSNFKFKEGRICLKFQIKKCLGPCESLISKDEYMNIVSDIKRFFKGNIEKIKEKFNEQMKLYSKNLAFEDAAMIRDRLLSLDKLFSKQSVTNITDNRSIDFFYKHSVNNINGITQIFIRNGKLIGISTNFFTDNEDETELLEKFVIQFYNKIRQFPEFIALHGDSYSNILEDVLSKMAGKQVHIKKKGLKGLIDLANENIQIQTEQYLKKVGERKDVLQRLSQLVEHKDIKRIECIDISHLAGSNTVGVSIVSVNGEFSKSDYRKYKITTAENDDFKGLYELFIRKGENIKEKTEEKADLYIIDGGVGQLNAVIKAAEKTNLKTSFISISKSRSIKHMKNETDNSIEQIHLPNRKNPIIFRKNDPLLHYIQSVRDEAHRFAITYNRKLAIKKLKYSPLLEVEGMGTKRLKQLLMAFPDIHTRKDIVVNDIIEKAAIPIEVAQKVYNFLHKKI